MRIGQAKPRRLVPGGDFEVRTVSVPMQPDDATGGAGICALIGAGL
jgi:hypothetical protein